MVDFDTFGNKPLAIEPFPPGTVFEYDRQNLSKVTIKVDYSEITWGDDIERMLTEYVKTKTVNQKEFSSNNKFLRIVHSCVSSAIFFGVFYFFLAIIFLRDDAASRLRDEYLAHFASPTLEEKVNAILIGAQSAKVSFPEYLGLAAKSVPLFAFLMSMALIVRVPTKCHIMLNDQAIFRYKENTKRSKELFYGVVVAFVVGLAVVFFSDFLKEMIVKRA